MPDEQEQAENIERLLHAPSYRVAYKDEEFLAGPRLRPVRMELELQKPELAFQYQQINSTIVVFGSTRIPHPLEAEKKLERARALEVGGWSRTYRHLAS